MAVRVTRRGTLTREAGEYFKSEVDIIRQSFYGAKVTHKVRDLTVDISGGANTVTVTDAIPAGAGQVIVLAKVLVAITGSGGLTGWTLGVSGAADRYTNSAKALTAGTKVEPSGYKTTETAFRLYPAAADLVFTANGAETFTSGKVRLIVAYLEGLAPTL